MTVLLVVALLTQAPARVPLPSKDKQASSRDDDWAAEQERAMIEAAKPRPGEFVITPPTGWSQGATKRFVGAFVGGLVGMAVPALLAAAATPPCPVFGCSISVGSVLAVAIAPAVSVVGATLGFTLMGGRMSAGAAIGGLIGGLASGVLFLLFHRVAVTESSEPQWGATIAAGAIAVALEAIALESRNDALDEAPFVEVPSARLALTTLGLLGTLAGGALLVAGLSFVAYPTGLAVASVIGVLGTLLAPLVPWAAHRGMGGEGTLGAAYLGWLASLALAGASVLGAASPFFSPISFSVIIDPRTLAMLGGGIGLAAIVTLLGTPLMLEWSHGNTLRERAKTAPINAQLSVAPLAGPQGLSGGALGVSGTF